VLGCVGESRTNPVARFDDGRGGWFVVASAGGATQHPGWYHNMVADPDQVWVEVSGARHHVMVEQLSGDDRSSAWQLITTQVPRFAGYETKTDRPIPVLRLTSDAVGS
jgi:deazaflavin-dependent oxidoreductase (nitroreductase family)